MVEQWKAIAEFPHYEISNMGNVRSIDRVVRETRRFIKTGMPVSQHSIKGGYKRVGLTNVKGQEKWLVHRLVAIHFIPNVYPRTKIFVNHKNGNTADNTVGNLEWMTASENKHHANERGYMAKGERAGMSKLSNEDVYKIRELHKGGMLPWHIKNLYPVGSRTIYNICKGISWRHLI